MRSLHYSVMQNVQIGDPALTQKAQTTRLRPKIYLSVRANGITGLQSALEISFYESLLVVSKLTHTDDKKRLG